MSVTLHPYKGYLNTLFHLYATGSNAVEYRVLRMSNNEEDEILNGIILPNGPFSLQIPLPGSYNVRFSDGTSIPVTVEDGYKFGGSKLKRAFIFDNCPWLFVVMYDRTYFYNRDTQIAYVEAISPDEITVINRDYVILKNKNYSEQSVYSLKEQKPILNISDIIYFNDCAIVWKEIDEKKTTSIIIYSFDTREKIHQTVDLFDIDKTNERLLYSHNNTIGSIVLSGNIEPKMQLDIKAVIGRGNVVGVIAPYLVLYYEKKAYENSIYVFNTNSREIIRRIPINGHLAQIGDNQIIDIEQRRKSIRDFDISRTEFPDAIIAADYFSFDFFPCEWEVFYTIKHTKLIKNQHRVNCEKLCYIQACNTDLNIRIKKSFDGFRVFGDSICLYNDEESFVRNKNYSSSGYHKGGAIYFDNSTAYLYEDSSIYRLSKNSYWDNCREGNFDFSCFDKFGVITNRDTDVCQTLGGVDLGKKFLISHIREPYILTDKYYIFSGARTLERSTNKLPEFLSNDLRCGINVTGDGVFTGRYENGNYSEDQILTDIFDPSMFRDVLFSEDGQSIMYRDEDKTIVTNIADSSSIMFDNVSFIRHINGIRPQFTTPASLQPRLINPVTKRPIDCNIITQFQYVSPDGNLYADTNLNEYIEYYWRSTAQPLSRTEYTNLKEKYTYPWQGDEKSTSWQTVKNLRRELVLKNFTFLKKEYPCIFKDIADQKWEEFVLDEKRYGISHFMDLFIGQRGIAVIRKISDNSILAKIDLGTPLWFINYVSFSYDNNYVAIAGRYPNGSGKGGLFLIYDLTRKQVLCQKTNSWAVWHTSFNKKGMVAGYSSEPITYEAQIGSGNNVALSEYQDYNFLTFSPDGELSALSNQGYVSKKRKDGAIRQNWGHQPSCDVFVTFSHDMGNIVAKFSDLSEEGIAECSDRKHNFPQSVASVSFSGDNKRLMMVGNDGVVIIRNLNFEENANK